MSRPAIDSAAGKYIGAGAPRPPVAIPPMPERGARPLWSVMIPTYNPSEPHLAQVLRSVLDQDPGPAEMQVAVVDDCSPAADIEAVVRRLAPGRVEFHRQASNVGLAGNWNACIDRARGHLVHILHQDDLVLPGFYDRLGRAACEQPDVGAFFCRHHYIDERGDQYHISQVERESPGILDDWLNRLAVRLRIQCPAIAVRRAVYEALGGFRSDLCYVLDWEMWVRIAARYLFWFDPQPMACYRSHPGNETARLKRDGADLADYTKGLEIICNYIPKEHREEAMQQALRWFSSLMMVRASMLLNARDRRAGMALVHTACRYNPELKYDGTLSFYRRWEIKLRIRELFNRQYMKIQCMIGSSRRL